MPSFRVNRTDPSHPAGSLSVAAGVLAGAAHRAVHIDWFGEISLSGVDHVRPIDQGPAQSLAGFVPLIN